MERPGYTALNIWRKAGQGCIRPGLFLKRPNVFFQAETSDGQMEESFDTQILFNYMNDFYQWKMTRITRCLPAGKHNAGETSIKANPED